METNVIIVDRIANVVVGNGVVRIECVAISGAGGEKPSGTVLIPGNIAGPVVQSLVNALQDLDRKAREAMAASSDELPETFPTGKFSSTRA
jgi:hypothetical protein